MKETVTKEMLEQFRQEFEAQRAHGIAMRAVVAGGVNQADAAGCLRP